MGHSKRELKAGLRKSKATRDASGPDPVEPLAPPPPARWASAASLAALSILFLSLSLQDMTSADFWWQLATGRWILAHSSVPTHDVFSYTVPDHSWAAMHWIYDTLLYLGWRAGGPALLVLAQAIVVCAAFLIALWPSRRQATTLPGVVILALGVATASPRFLVRPEIVTYLLISTFLVLLEGASQGRFPRAAWMLPVLQVLWTNTHTLFIFGPVLAWIFTAGDALRRLRKRWTGAAQPFVDRRLVLLALLVTGACWISPYGNRGAMKPLQLFHAIHKESFFGDAILEFRSPFALTTWGWDLWLAAILVAASFGSFLGNLPRLDVTRLAVWAGVLYTAGVANRNVGLFAFVAVWATLRNLDEAGWPGRFSGRAVPAAHAALALLLAASAWYVATDRYAMGMGRPHRMGLGVAPWSTAAEATAFLLEAGCPPQLFHDMADGAYVAWAAEGRLRVFVDGRLQLYGEDFVKAYVEVGPASWDAFARRFRINTVLLEHQRFIPLIQKLRSSSEWALVHLDNREVVFVRDAPEHAELIRRFRIDARQPWTPRRPEPDETPSAWWRRLGTVGLPWHSLGMAKAFLLLGGVDNAQRYLERGHERFPENPEIRLTLAQVYRSRGRDSDADRLLAGLDVPPAAAARAARLLAELVRVQGRPAEAIAPLERAVAERPNDAALHAALGQAHLMAGDFGRAIPAYHRAVELDPRPSAPWEHLGHACEQLGDLDGAIDAYRHAVERNRSLYRVYNQLGVLYLRRKDPRSAARYFEEALRIKPDFDLARRNLDLVRSPRGGPLRP